MQRMATSRAGSLQEGLQTPFKVYLMMIIFLISPVERHEVGGVEGQNLVCIMRGKCIRVETLNVYSQYQRS